MEFEKYTLDEVGEIVSGATPKTSDESNFGGDIAWITPADLSGYTEKYISHGVRNLTQKGYESCSTRLMPKGTVLFTSRAPIGYVAIAANEICTNQGFKSIIPNHDIIDSEFLYYQLIFLRNEIQNKGTGTTFKEVSSQKMKEVIVRVPSLADQRKIVSRIEELFSQLDASEATLRTVKNQLVVYRQAVLKDAFSSCNETKHVSDVCCHVTDGDHMPPPKAESGIPFIMISNIKDNQIDWTNTAFVGNEYYNKVDMKRKPQKGDVLYTVTGSYGIPVLVDFDKEFCFQRHIALLRPNDSIYQKFLYYALMEPGVYSQASKRSTGTAQKTVGLGALRSIEIPFVSDKEKQTDIITGIDSKLSLCTMIQETVNKCLAHTSGIRQSILKQAFEGEA